MLTKPAKVQSQNRELNQAQDNIARALAPLFQNALADGIQLKGINLTPGANTINHTLGRALQGWVIIRQRSSATVYDTQDSNALPDKTLNLIASAPASVDLYVF